MSELVNIICILAFCHGIYGHFLYC